MSVPAQIPISGPYLANGSTTQFAYKFYLLFATDLQVFVGGVVQQLNNAYTVTGVGNSQGGNVVFNTAPANGLEVLIKRATPYTRQTDYADNGDLLADVVNDDFDRIWLALQEINASFSSSISKPVGGNWDAQSLRINNLLDGTQPQDAVTLKQLNTVNGSAGQSAAAAADSAAAASASEANAASSQQAAASSASAASTSASNSSNSASLAQKWAANPVGTEVIAGKYSALHYASKAGDSASSAANSASGASSSADSASGYASAAAQSATSAKADADRAQSANPDNQLKKASNLSDVADVAQSRANLGVSYGNASGTVAQGNDSRIVNAVQKSGGTLTGSLEFGGGGYAITKPPSAFNAGANSLFSVSLNDARYVVNSDFYYSGQYVTYRVFTGDPNNGVRVWEFRTDGTFRSQGAVYANGTALTSDMRLKSDFRDVDINPDDIDKILPQTYTKKSPDDPDDVTSEMGIVAQKIEAVIPELVTKFYWNEDYPDLRMVNYSGLTAWLVGYCKKLKDRIAVLESSDEAKGAVIAELQKRMKAIDGMEA